MNFDRKNFFSGLIIGLCLGLIAGVIAMVLKSRTQPAPIIIMPPEATPTALPTATAAPLRVFVSGAVVNSDVYHLSPGSLVSDAIRAAGGFTAEAAQHRINLAQPLADGLHIHVATQEEAVALPSGSASSTTAVSTDLPSNPAGELININFAALTELTELPGIGPSTAQSIIDYREANGPFTAIADIMKVSGIGQGRFDQIKDLISVD